MKYAWRLLIVWALAATTACSGTQNDQEATPVAALPALEGGVSLSKLWSHSVGAQGKHVASGQLLPAVDGDRLYAANADGRVVALDTGSGKVLWKAKLDNPVASSVAAQGNAVALATRDGRVHLLNSQSGELVWSAQASSEVLAAPAISYDVVVVQPIDSRLQAFDAADGNPRWRYSGTAAPLTLRGNAAPVLADGMVYSVFDNGKLAALDARTGLQIWEQRFALADGRNEIERLIDAQATPLVSADVVVAAAYNQAIVGFERGTGRPQWDSKASVGRDMAQAEGSVFAVDVDDHVLALREATGREVWKSTALAGRGLSAPAVLGDYVAVADREGYIHLLSVDDGQYSGRYRISSGNSSVRLQAAGGRLYALTAAGKLYSLTLKN